MDNAKQITISNIPELSAIYFALLQCGYNYYAIGRNQGYIEQIEAVIEPMSVPSFFSGVRQNTCEVYPYWPRAFILETALHYLQQDRTGFRDFDALKKCIMSAENLTEEERDSRLWDWIHEFPSALSQVLSDDAFHLYLEWENEWIADQNTRNESELRTIERCLEICASRYQSRVREIRIVINPIKCVYSSDYHLDGSRFIFTSGSFRMDSIIHEFLHHVVHPFITRIADCVTVNRTAYPGIDESYYLSGDDDGWINAYEEFVVREMTKSIIAGNYPEDLTEYLLQLVSEE